MEKVAVGEGQAAIVTTINTNLDDKNGKVITHHSKFIKAGDLVIIFMSRDKPPVPITVTPGLESTNTYGSFSHDKMVGLPFGAKLASRNKRGFIHLLRPNPELWTLALPHRTQIVYTPDMSFIAAQLGITPGARVIEAGTGSGSFSHYLTRTVARNHAQSRGHGWKGKLTDAKGQNQRNGRTRDREDADKDEDGLKLEDSEEELSKKEPANHEEAETMRLLSREPDLHVDSKDGRVWSFEFHAGRAVKAWDEFQDHGLFPTLSLRHRNVCKNGFGLQDVADAVFLDLPAPWEALKYASKALRSDVAGRICCFSPCIEQVLKTVEAFRNGGSSNGKIEEEARWVDIETYECLNRTHLSIWAGVNGQTGNSSIQDAITRIKTVEERKGKRREAQIARVKKERLDRLKQTAKEAGDKEGDEVEMTDEDGQPEKEVAVPVVSGEKRKRDEGKEESTEAGDFANKISCKDGRTLNQANVYARTFTEMKGHTSYLTFATLLPRTVKQEVELTPQPVQEEKAKKIV